MKDKLIQRNKDEIKKIQVIIDRLTSEVNTTRLDDKIEDLARSIDSLCREQTQLSIEIKHLQQDKELVQ